MKATLADRVTAEHGLLRGRLCGCSCPICSAAVACYRRRLKRELDHAHWRSSVDVAPVQAHLARLLAAGYNLSTIASIAGLDVRTVRRAAFMGVAIPAETAASLLAIPRAVRQSEGSAMIDAATTREQIQALIAAGYSRNWIAARASLSGRLPLDRIRIRASTARVVAGLYAEVGLRPGPSDRARAEGKRRGWPTPFELDDGPRRSGELAPTLRRRSWQPRIAS